MADLADIAQDLIERRLEEDLRIAKLRRGAGTPADWDGETCYDCAGEIDPARLRLGYHTCIHCQEVRELRMKLNGGKL